MINPKHLAADRPPDHDDVNCGGCPHCNINLAALMHFDALGDWQSCIDVVNAMHGTPLRTNEGTNEALRMARRDHPYAEEAPLMARYAEGLAIVKPHVTPDFYDKLIQKLRYDAVYDKVVKHLRETTPTSTQRRTTP